jgi:hypothetical protein
MQKKLYGSYKKKTLSKRQNKQINLNLVTVSLIVKKKMDSGNLLMASKLSNYSFVFNEFFP